MSQEEERRAAVVADLVAALERVLARVPNCNCAECHAARDAVRKAKGEA